MGGRSSRRYGPRQAWCGLVSSATVGCMLGRQQRLSAVSRRPCGFRLHGTFNITAADVTSSGNDSDDEDSSEEMIYSTVFPGWEISVAKNEYAASTSKELPLSLDPLLLLQL